MPSTTVIIQVSRREADRPRLLQAQAFQTNIGTRSGLTPLLAVDDNGTFADDDAIPVRDRRFEIPAGGIVLLQWYEWPRNGPARDFTSTVMVSWDDDAVVVRLEDLFE